MAFLIDPPVTRPGVYCICFGRDCISGIFFSDISSYCHSPICLVTQNICACQIHMGQDVYSKDVVIYISFGKLEIDRVAQTIYDCMDLCGIPTAGLPYVLAGVTV